MKIPGLLAVVCAIFVYGSGRLRSLREELSCTESLMSGLIVVRSELAARLSPLAELMRKAADAVTGETAGFFGQTAERLSDLGETDFVDAWDELCQKALPSLPQAIRTELEKLGRSLGRFDLDDQLSACDRLLTELDGFLKEDRRRYREQRRMTLTLCGCAACLVSLLAL